MNSQNKLKLVHFVSTGWLILSAVYLMVTALLQAGKSWWFIASVTGHSAIAVFVLINLYLFSIFRGIGRNQKSMEEHPLSNSTYYVFFYDICPFLGTLAGAVGAIGAHSINHYLLITATGALWTTFLVWIIVDPIVGLVEMLLPSSRAQRKERLAKVRAKRQKERLNKEKLLADLEVNERRKREQWEKTLRPYAGQLAELLTAGETPEEYRQGKAIDTGVTAWQIGGIECMKQLHSMAIRECKERCNGLKIMDHITIWWDGIGSWQSRWLDGECEPIL